MIGFSVGGDGFDFHDKKAGEKYGNGLPFSKFIPCDFPSGFNKIPDLILMVYMFFDCPGGGIGRRARFRSVCPNRRAGSTPVSGTFFKLKIQTSVTSLSSFKHH